MSTASKAGAGAVAANLAAEKRAQAQTQSLHDYRAQPHHSPSAAPLSTIETKHFSTLALIGLCYCILNSWTAASASMSIALVSGGPSVTLWGMLVAFVGVMACALSLAEICHVYPTTGGQYHLAYLLSPARWQYVIAYFTGWIAVAGWVALTATASSLAGQFIVGIIALLLDMDEILFRTRGFARFDAEEAAVARAASEKKV